MYFVYFFKELLEYALTIQMLRLICYKYIQLTSNITYRY